jgi:hypothetical protein
MASDPPKKSPTPAYTGAIPKKPSDGRYVDQPATQAERGELIHTTQASEPSPDRNPFHRYSLRGRATDLALNATQATPLPGKFIFLGHMTTIYAAPGTGKTLIMMYILLEAIRRGIIDPNGLYYLNADDNSLGLATKTALLEEVGAHMMAPGERGFQTGDLAKLLLQAAEGGFARGMCLVLDTLKKFTDLMDKKRSADFAQICRLFVSAGGTIISIAHTTKNSNADGSPRYQGTTDMLEDGDATYVAQLFKPMSGAANKVVKFAKLKNRADCPDAVAYTYAVEPGLSYEGMVASVQPIHPDELDDYVPHREVTVDEAPVINALAQLIKGGAHGGKMALSRAAAETCGVSQRAAIGVLERYTGKSAEEQCFWTMRRGHRGVQKYELLPPPE